MAWFAKVAGVALIFAVVIFVIWRSLPLNIYRYSDIKFAENIIVKIETFKKIKGLPAENDREMLSEFGFRDKIDYFEPEYHVIDNDTYELIFQSLLLLSHW